MMVKLGGEKCDVILVAGGSGHRFGTGIPKQFDLISGKPLYLWSLEVFLRWKNLGETVLVVPQSWVQRIHDESHLLKEIHVVAGGSSREGSVALGLREIRAISENHWVMIHDAVRPAFTTQLLDRLWEAKEKHKSNVRFGGVVPGIQVTETVKRIENGFVGETVPREKLCVIQTPQLMKADFLGLALEKYADEGADGGVTDDAGLMEKNGYEIAVIPGEYDNLKVTFAEDRERVSSWLGKRHPQV